ncbi:MAG: hypothetical protein QNI84_14145 [Henriciella sp.]|nr:hypothetical protein [Henriciella sp.]
MNFGHSELKIIQLNARKEAKYRESGVCMATPENTAQDQVSGGSSIADKAASSALRTQLDETLANSFRVATGSAEQRVQANMVRQLWSGQLDPSQLSIRINGADLIILRNQLEQSAARKSAENHLFLVTLNALQDQIDALGRQIDDMEADFENRYGDAWREDLALDILDEDIIPQRMDGESLADYRDRVEQALIDEMLDENGNIKPEYRDHPKYGEFAQWARKEWELRQARIAAAELDRVANDPEASTEERNAAFETANDQALWLARDEGSEAAQRAAERVADKRMDKTTATSASASEMDAFSSYTG